jgi:GAF domain-containing protein
MTKTTVNPEAIIEDPVRLQVLDSLELLDSPTEAAFDRLTRLASMIVNAPVSLVTLIDADRQFFKSFFGLPEPVATNRETPLSHSFCQYVVATGEPLIVADARENEMLKDNLAIPDFGVIGYLGMPLTTSDGVALGSFCVLDDKPREWTEHDIEVIRELAVSVMTEIELRSQIQARQLIQDELMERNRKYKRVYRFAQSTVNHMDESIRRGSTKDELLTYLDDMTRELDKLS